MVNVAEGWVLPVIEEGVEGRKEGTGVGSSPRQRKRHCAFSVGSEATG